MLVLMSAMQIELKGLEKDLQKASSHKPGDGTVFTGNYQGKPLAWVISGIGRANAQQAVSEVSKNIQADTLLSLGFAGGLSPQLAIGDLVICENIGSLVSRTECYRPDAELLKIAKRVGDRLPGRTWYADCLTVENMLHTPTQKAALYEKWNYAIVEMENFWIAEKASQLGLRFLAARSISDTAQESLPDFDRIIDPSGEISFLGSVRHFAGHPQDIKLLPGLYQNSKLASKKLLEFLTIFVHEAANLKGDPEYAH